MLFEKEKREVEVMNFLDERKITAALEQENKGKKVPFREVIAKARELNGLDDQDVSTLIRAEDSESIEEMFETAQYVKEKIYGRRLVLFAPLYIANKCNNECGYCAFRHDNRKLSRKSLSQEEIKAETEVLLSQGHKRLLLVSGEESTREELEYILKSIESIYSVKTQFGNIRRVNVNIAPLEVSGFKRLFSQKIGTYQCFQETYHQPSYESVHTGGKKRNFLNRLMTMDRAFTGGGHDVGIGVLFGLYDWRYEILAMLQHINHLESEFGVGPHTISIPRIEPANNSTMSENPPFVVTDPNFLKIISILRMAVPYTGLILSTRERPEIRKRALELGISQISAGSKTNPGGYRKTAEDEEQFSLGDTRSLHEVIESMIEDKFIPSFCTGCYRKGRVGKDFMDLAKPGLIQQYCMPNALFSFQEYLCDFASPSLKMQGQALIHNIVENQIQEDKLKECVVAFGQRISLGERDLYL